MWRPALLVSINLLFSQNLQDHVQKKFIAVIFKIIYPMYTALW